MQDTGFVADLSLTSILPASCYATCGKPPDLSWLILEMGTKQSLARATLVRTKRPVLKHRASTACPLSGGDCTRVSELVL